MSHKTLEKNGTVNTRISRDHEILEEHYREMYGGETWTAEEVEAFRKEVIKERKAADKIRRDWQRAIA